MWRATLPTASKATGIIVVNHKDLNSAPPWVSSETDSSLESQVSGTPLSALWEPRQRD